MRLTVSCPPLHLALHPAAGNKPDSGSACKMPRVSPYVSNTIIPRMKFQKKHRHSSFEHPLLISRFLTCFGLAVQKTPGLDIVELYPEGKYHDEVTFFDGEVEVTLPIKPDGTIVVEDTRDSRMEKLG